MSSASLRLRSAAGVAGCAVAGATVAFLLGLRQPFGLGDEGFQYLLSRAWAQGDAIFSHFRVLYPIGQYVWLGSFMRVLGDGLWAFRLARSLLTGAAAGAVYATLRGRGGSSLAWSVALAVAVVDGSAVVTLAAMAVFGAAQAAARLPRPALRHVVAAAILAGLLAGWREDAAFLALVLAVYLAVRCGEPVKALAAATAGVVLGFLPWLVIAGFAGEATPFLAHEGQRLAFLFGRLGGPQRDVAAPPFSFSPRGLGIAALPVLLFLPPAFYLAIGGREFVHWRQGAAVERERLAAAAVGLAFVPQYLWERPDFWHFRSHLPVLLAVAGVWVVHQRWPRLGVTTAAFCAVALVGAGLLVAQHALANSQPYPCCNGERIGARLEGGRPPWAELPRAPGDTLIAFPWGAGWYVLEGIPAGTRVLSGFERHLRQGGALAELLRDLEAPSNRWVITLGDRPGSQAGEAERAVMARVGALYAPVARWQGWQLWRRAYAGAEGTRLHPSARRCNPLPESRV